jgi:hypothetical protein
MGTLTQPKKTAEIRGDQNLKAASLLLCSMLAGCASPWGNSAPSASSPPSIAPAVSQAAVGSPQPTALAAEEAPPSDGVHPNQTITDLFRTSSSPRPAPGPGPAPAPATANAANVPHPPSSYTPSGQPYTPPAQPAYGTPQNSGDVSAASDTDSDGVHPSQSITDLFRH